MNQRQARYAVNQTVRESSENFEVMMIQEIHNIPNLHEGRMKQNERRVAREAPRGQRSHMLEGHTNLPQAGEKEKVFVKKPDALGAAVTNYKLSKLLT